jgi:hypothetical protein
MDGVIAPPHLQVIEIVLPVMGEVLFGPSYVLDDLFMPGKRNGFSVIEFFVKAGGGKVDGGAIGSEIDKPVMGDCKIGEFFGKELEIDVLLDVLHDHCVFGQVVGKPDTGEKDAVVGDGSCEKRVGYEKGVTLRVMVIAAVEGPIV